MNGGEYRKNENKTRKMLNQVCNDCALAVNQSNKLVLNNLKNLPQNVNEDKIKSLIDANRCITIYEIAIKLNLSQSIVDNYIKQLGLISMLDTWVPNVLTENNLYHRIYVCNWLLKRQKNYPFLKNIITGDERFIVYKEKTKKSLDLKTKSSQITNAIQLKKVMISIWWNVNGIILFEPLPVDVEIGSETYFNQLDKLNDSLEQNRPELANSIWFHHNNELFHTSSIVRQKIIQFNWQVLPHPEHSPDLSPTDYYLLPHIKNFLNDKTFVSIQEMQNNLEQFIGGKSKDFYETGIMQLPERWQKVLDQNGQYINQSNSS